MDVIDEQKAIVKFLTAEGRSRRPPTICDFTQIISTVCVDDLLLVQAEVVVFEVAVLMLVVLLCVITVCSSMRCLQISRKSVSHWSVFAGGVEG